MASAAGLVLAAGGIAAANEAIFVPIAEGKDFGKSVSSDTNLWRIVPAVGVLALILTGLEKVSEPLGKGLAGLVLLAVIVIPFGNAPSPLDSLNAALKVNKLESQKPSLNPPFYPTPTGKAPSGGIPGVTAP